MTALHQAQIRRIIASDTTGVPILVDGQRLVIVRPSEILLLDRVVVADVESMTGDRIMLTLEALLPLSNHGWPHAAARQAHEMFLAAVEGDGL